MKKLLDYSKCSDSYLLEITNIHLNKGGIPLQAVKEVQKRGLKKFVNRTINSHDFDENGNFISNK
jgi:hypothetical protein